MKVIAAAALAVSLSACAPMMAGPANPLGALQAANMTLNAYCAMTPEGRAEIRRKLRLRAQFIACDGDPAP